MSVYKPKRSPYWAYDFVIQGRRYTGSTGQETRKAAEAFERRKRTEIAEGRDKKDAGELALEVAAWRWYRERAQGSRSASTTERRIKIMLQCVGPKTKLRDIDGNAVAEAIERRRGMLARGRLVANATVNRDIICPLRTILRRARVWGARNMPDVPWSELKLKERPELVQEYTAAERAAWIAAAGEYGPAEQIFLEILLLNGPRFGEMFFPPAAVNALRKEVLISDRKCDAYSTLTLLLSDDHARRLGRLAAHALAEGWDNCWGIRYWQMYHRLRQAAQRAGLRHERVIHGARHHSASAIVRQSGNLKAAQAALGHASITSTARYAHVSKGDLRSILEAVSRNSPGQEDRHAPETQGRQGENG